MCGVLFVPRIASHRLGDDPRPGQFSKMSQTQSMSQSLGGEPTSLGSELRSAIQLYKEQLAGMQELIEGDPENQQEALAVSR